MSKDEVQHGIPEGVPVVRCVAGGVFMGLANLVPGISGGTMLLAAGVYRRFIGAVSELSTLRFRAGSIAVVALIGLAALGAIGGLAGTMKMLVIEHRWVMYSLFIGLTLGGVPILHKLARPIDARAVAGTVLGLALMVGMFVFSPDETVHRHSMGFMFAAGVLGASAMILPGISGAYLLILLGVYVPILASVDRVKGAVIYGGDIAAALQEWRVVVPVGIGVVVGIAGVSNLLKWLLLKHEKVTVGFLLGLVVGSVLGLWPFKVPVRPAETALLEETLGREVAAGPGVNKDEWPLEPFTPGAAQIAASIGLIGVGFAMTMGVAWIGREKPKRD